MEIVVVVAIVIFVYVMRKAFTTINNNEFQVSQIYINGNIYEIDEDKIVSGNGKEIDKKNSYFEELASNLKDLSKECSIFSSQQEYVAISNFLSKLKGIHTPITTHYEMKEYSPAHQYGGCYIQSENNCQTVHIIGNTEAVLHHCKDHTDKEEIQRIAQKMSTNNRVLAVASEDCTDMQKNVLLRGVKNKMTFIGLIAISHIQKTHK